ncbi:hypothetical protein KOW79_002915 [Hemibagrus wyckioides]|uniref:C-type lectin domain-containing protein n=1 Tax=Hemibagrus wyckioides TaxID=337641 RepID=A0A9D3P4I3_9TELE|nr:C-type mannose receptor 2-like [Hemibagrus wyckioides]KAG7334508.1 hypothetical protein KOW79_002915 [Hemibagrus wyckioides]
MKSSRLISVASLLFLGWTAEALTREYFNSMRYMNWPQAQQYCAGQYRGLAVVTSVEEYSRLQDVYTGNGWIGMYRSERNASVWLWVDGKEHPYTHWENDQPNNIGGVQNCVYIMQDGWNDIDCQNVALFYCYRSIILVEEKKTWEQANNYCREHYSTMAFPEPGNPLQLAEQEAMQNQTVRVWTGIRFLNRNWYSVDRKLVENVFMPSCPGLSNRCGARNIRTNVWENRDCDEELPFLCYW